MNKKKRLKNIMYTMLIAQNVQKKPGIIIWFFLIIVTSLYESYRMD